MPKSPSIVDYVEARSRLASQLSSVAFGECPTREAATAASASLGAMRAFRKAPRISSYGDAAV